MKPAHAEDFQPDARLPDDYELEAGFRLAEEVRALHITRAERIYLDAALALR